MSLRLLRRATTALACTLGLLAAAPASAQLDVLSPAGQLDAFMRIRADASGKPVFANWWVTMFAVVPGERPRPILRLEGFNVGRFAKGAEGTTEFITREVAFYRDLGTWAVVDEWNNPFTNEKNAVLHVANDPVNSRYGAPDGPSPTRLPFMVSGNEVFLRLDIPLAYPNPLTPAEYPAESSGPTYLASEHFTFFAKKSDLDNPRLTSVPSTWAWSRTGPWLPWMKMGQRPGYLLYSGHGRKFDRFEDLPADLQQLTTSRFPEYQTAPTTYTTPNETSWTYYKKKFPPRKP
ncbi:MAG: DUF1838 family protein [Rubrivivax sp.]|nr:DUF1838 family protein [Rubrivivax sp.]